MNLTKREVLAGVTGVFWGFIVRSFNELMVLSPENVRAYAIVSLVFSIPAAAAMLIWLYRTKEGT